VIEAELPGINRENIDIKIQDKLLTLQSTKKKIPKTAKIRTSSVSVGPFPCSAALMQCRRSTRSQPDSRMDSYLCNYPRKNLFSQKVAKSISNNAS
jgi:hypothetical protein